MRYLVMAAVLAWGYGQWSDFQDYKPRQLKAKQAEIITDALIRPG